MGAGNTVNQHFVPQFYMRYWGSGRGNKHLWQYLKRPDAMDAYCQCSTDDKGCCNSPNLYELSNLEIVTSDDGWLSPNYLEHAFCEREREWSHRFKDLFSRLDEGRFITDVDAVLICDFVASLCVRNPIVMAAFSSRIDDIISSVLSVKELAPVWNMLRQFSPNFADVYLRPTVEKQVLMPNKSLHIDEPRGPIEGAVYGDYLNWLRHDRLFLLYSENGAFVFSDMPVLHIGFKDLKYIACPLSPKYAVVFVPRKHVNRWCTGTGCVSNRLNSVTDRIAYSCFFSYFGLNCVSRIYGESEVQLRRAVEAFKSVYGM